MLSCLIRVFQKRSFFLLSFSGVRRTLRNGTERMDGGCVHCLPASAEREREEKGRGSTAFACTLARFGASTPVATRRYRRWLARLRTPSPSLPSSLSSACLPGVLPPSSSSASFSALHLCLGARSVRTVAGGRTTPRRRGGCNNTR